jgi:TPR repeat protein
MAAQYTQQHYRWVRLAIVTAIYRCLLLGLLVLLTGCVRYDDGQASFDAGDYQNAFARWHLLAKFGDPRAQNEIGWMYQHGLGIDPDPTQAARWYRKAAVQGLAVAQTNLGIMYNDGAGVARDPREAARLFDLAARQNDAAALNNLGVLYDKGVGVPEDNRRAAELLQKAAELGHPRAMSNLGLLYKNGEGVPQDAVTAVKWFRASAEKNDREGLNNLAVMLDNGVGTPADRAEAMKLFGRAARAGESAAALNIALMYLRTETNDDKENDDGGSRLIEAYAWLNVAASQGQTEAATRRRELSVALKPEQIAKAQARSLKLLER